MGLEPITFGEATPGTRAAMRSSNELSRAFEAPSNVTFVTCVCKVC